MENEKIVVVVTGASRGAGRGIAIALGSHGCTVYVTGRSQQPGDSPLPGTIYETAEAVERAGGSGIAVRVDHAEDDQVRALFERVRREQGRLDILVNNAFFQHEAMTGPGRFWEKPLELVECLDVGLRSSYVASYYAAPLLVERERALVAFTSATGAVHYAFGPAYGVQKAGTDKMAADMAVDFQKSGVAVVSIWMGAVATERLEAMMAKNPDYERAVRGILETPEFTGHVIWALYNDPGLKKISGQTVIGAEMAVKYGIRDEGGRQPPSFRDLHKVEPRQQYPVVFR